MRPSLYMVVYYGFESAVTDPVSTITELNLRVTRRCRAVGMAFRCAGSPFPPPSPFSPSSCARCGHAYIHSFLAGPGGCWLAAGRPGAAGRRAGGLCLGQVPHCAGATRARALVGADRRRFGSAGVDGNGHLAHPPAAGGGRAAGGGGAVRSRGRLSGDVSQPAGLARHPGGVGRCGAGGRGGHLCGAAAGRGAGAGLCRRAAGGAAGPGHCCAGAPA